MAAHLVRAGLAVRGFDIAPAARERLAAAGGVPATSPADAAAGASALVVMVHDARQAREVLFGAEGAAPALAKGAAVWLASTIAPDDARAIGADLAAIGLHMVDGPVSGGATGAQSGTLTVMAGGDDTPFDTLAPVFAACTARVFRVGPIGAGSTVKLVNQLLTASHIALTAEALALGARAGVDPALMIEVVTASAGNSVQFAKRAPRMAAGDHAPQSTVNIFLKDLGIALDAARSLQFPVPLAAAAHQVFTMAAGAGFGRESDTNVLRVYERMGGVDVAAVAGAHAETP